MYGGERQAVVWNKIPNKELYLRHFLYTSSLQCDPESHYSPPLSSMTPTHQLLWSPIILTYCWPPAHFLHTSQTLLHFIDLYLSSSLFQRTEKHGKGSSLQNTTRNSRIIYFIRILLKQNEKTLLVQMEEGLTSELLQKTAIGFSLNWPQ